jgi:hypothetical protein
MAALLSRTQKAEVAERVEFMLRKVSEKIKRVKVSVA